MSGLPLGDGSEEGEAWFRGEVPDIEAIVSQTWGAQPWSVGGPYRPEKVREAEDGEDERGGAPAAYQEAMRATLLRLADDAEISVELLEGETSAEAFRRIQAQWRSMSVPLGDLGDIVVLRADNGWHRACKIVGITDIAPHRREYRVRELTMGADDGADELYAEAAEVGWGALRLERDEETQGCQLPEGQDDDSQQVGDDHGLEEHRQDQSRPGGEAGREEAQRQGFDGQERRYAGHASGFDDEPGGRQERELQRQVGPRPARLVLDRKLGGGGGRGPMQFPGDPGPWRGPVA